MAKTCLKCECPINEDPGMIRDAGVVEVRFLFGSAHDQSNENRPPSPLNKLLDCDEIRAYICDECFELFSELFEGYRHKFKVNEERVI